MSRIPPPPPPLPLPEGLRCSIEIYGGSWWVVASSGKVLYGPERDIKRVERWERRAAEHNLKVDAQKHFTQLAIEANDRS